MDNLTFDFTITPDTIIAIAVAIITIIGSIIGGIYAVVTNTKKYELTEEYRKELLGWYKETVSIMVKIIHFTECNDLSSDKLMKTELLSNLSSQVEIGRFYFPNVVENDKFGSEKPSAYQGYRQVVLEYLMRFYYIASSSNPSSRIRLLWQMERNFTSHIFDAIDPRKRNKLYSKYTAITLPKGQSIEDFLREDPNNVNIFV